MIETDTGFILEIAEKEEHELEAMEKMNDTTSIIGILAKWPDGKWVKSYEDIEPTIVKTDYGFDLIEPEYNKIRTRLLRIIYKKPSDFNAYEMRLAEKQLKPCCVMCKMSELDRTKK